jgi:hypothetical protein
MNFTLIFLATLLPAGTLSEHVDNGDELPFALLSQSVVRHLHAYHPYPRCRRTGQVAAASSALRHVCSYSRMKPSSKLPEALREVAPPPS